MRVLIDVDGVVADFEGLYLDRARELFGIEPSVPNDRRQWDIKTWFDPVISAKQEEEILSVGFPHLIKPYPGAVQAIHEIAFVHEVHFVTSHFKGLKYWAHLRDEWLHTFFGGIADRTHHTHHKYVVLGDVFIDDKPEHVLSWHEYHPTGRAILWAHSYNEHAKIPTSVCRTNSWDYVQGLL